MADKTLAQLLTKVVKTETVIKSPTVISGTKVGERKPVGTIKIPDMCD
jgi:hypothetical protein